MVQTVCGLRGTLEVLGNIKQCWISVRNPSDNFPSGILSKGLLVRGCLGGDIQASSRGM